MRRSEVPALHQCCSTMHTVIKLTRNWKMSAVLSLKQVTGTVQLVRRMRCLHIKAWASATNTCS